MPSIDAINGIGRRDAVKLRRNGIRTTEAFLRRASTRAGRTELAEATGLDEGRLLDWLHMADLMRIKGIGSEYADLLEAVGVGTVRDLRRRSPKALLKRMSDYNDVKKLVRRLPTPGMVESWVGQAKTTEPAVRS